MSQPFGNEPARNDVQMTQPCSEPPPPLLLPQVEPLYWIEIELVYEDDGSPVVEEEYCITLPDGVDVHGFLDDRGRAMSEELNSPVIAR